MKMHFLYTRVRRVCCLGSSFTFEQEISVMGLDRYDVLNEVFEVSCAHRVDRCRMNVYMMRLADSAINGNVFNEAGKSSE